jgi:hypothetical protein
MTDKKKPQTFTQLDGLNKTYAHFLLFKEDSPTLDAILDIFVPDQKPLFKNMFTVLNKKHVKAGLQQFGYINNQISLGGFSERKHFNMTTYMNLPFSDTMDQEIHANKFLIDVIHEAVITHFSVDDAISSKDPEDITIVKGARTNLQTSLQGYRGKRGEYIEPPATPPQSVNAMKNELTNIKDKTLSNIPNVSHMEAIAELHRRAFLMVSDQDKADLMVDAKIVATTPAVTTTTPSVPTSKSTIEIDGKNYQVVEVTSDGRCLSASVFFIKDYYDALNENNLPNIEEIRKKVMENLNDNIKKIISDVLIKDRQTYIPRLFMEHYEEYTNPNSQQKKQIEQLYNIDDTTMQNIYDEVALVIQEKSPKKFEDINENILKKLNNAFDIEVQGYYNNNGWQSMALVGEILANYLQKHIKSTPTSRKTINFGERYSDTVYVHYSGNHYQAVIPYMNISGGSTKKAKTRKPRIFKKWKSRRRRM